jgi:enoyl-CoA hydratase/carnithine racemase
LVAERSRGLPAFVGRGRAFEMLLASEVIDGDFAERYGVVNRSRLDA